MEIIFTFIAGMIMGIGVYHILNWIFADGVFTIDKETEKYMIDCKTDYYKLINSKTIILRVKLRE